MYGEHIQNAIGRENICFEMDKERYERHSKDTYTVNGKEIDFNLIDCTDAKPTDLLIVAVKYNSLASALDTMKTVSYTHLSLAQASHFRFSYKVSALSFRL